MMREIFIGMDIYELMRNRKNDQKKSLSQYLSVCPWCPGYPGFPAPQSPAAIYNENDTRKFELSPVIIVEASSRHNFILDTVI